MVELANDIEGAHVASATAELERASAALTVAELRSSTATRELERSLKVEDLLTEKELELARDSEKQAQTVLIMAQREVAKAEAQASLARAVYENTLVRAPFDGLVSRIHVSLGMMPKPTETTLLDLLTPDELVVEIALPLKHLKTVKPGMHAELVVEEDEASVATSTVGRVAFVYPEVDPRMRMFRVKLMVEVRDGVLPGMLATVRLDLDSAP